MSANAFLANRRRNLLLAVLLPIVLVLVGLWSVASTSQATGKVPAVIVNNDQMVEQANKDGSTTQVVAGRLLVSWLTHPDHAEGYDWQLANAETAQEMLDNGTAYVAVTIPEDFSAAVVSAGTGNPQPARITVVTNQAHDYRTGEVTQQVFDGLVAQFGQQLTNQIAVGIADGLNESAEGLQQAADGAGQLADGAGELGNGFDQYADGTAQLAEGASLSADGAAQLADGASQLDAGVGQYVNGVEQYVAGGSELVGGVHQYVSGVHQYTSGVDQYLGGVQELNAGMQQLDEGATQLDGAVAQLDKVSGQLQGVSGRIDEARATIGQLQPVVEQLASIDPSALSGICERITEPELAAECTAAVDELAANVSGIDIDPAQISDGFDRADQALTQLAGAGDQLGQLASGLGQFTGGVHEAAAGSAQLAAAAGELRDGGSQLRAGGADLDAGASRFANGGSQLSGSGGQLAAGTGELAAGAGELSSGLGELADGAGQLDENSAPLSDGIGELENGARTMQSSLQDGADQARNAISDPNQFADVVAEPVRSSTDATHDPGFAGLLAALLLPVGTWLAGFVTALRRRLVTDELLNSSASNLSILLAGVRRMSMPITVVALVLSLLLHLIGGVPWAAFGGTLLFALLTAGATAALHLLFAVFWPRRNAAIVSVTLLLVQLLTLRGVIPFEWRAGWVGTVSNFLPIGQAASGLQSLYAGGPFASMFGPAAGLVLLTLFATVVATVGIGSRRRSNAAKLAVA